MNRRDYLARLREPSTWAGLGVVAVAFGVPPGTFDLIAQLGLTLAGTLAIFIPEKKQ